MPRPNADRTWRIDLEDPLDPGELEQAIGEIVLILQRLGGSASIVAERRKYDEDLYLTTALYIKHNLYASPVRGTDEEYERGPAAKPVESNGSEVAVEAG